MKFFVNVKGVVKSDKTEVYAIDATSHDEAKQIAISNFKEDFSVNEESEIECSSFQREPKRLIGTILILLIPVFLSFFHWYAPGSHDSLSISPNITSILVSLILFSSFVVRFKGIASTVSSITDIFISVELILLFSSIIRMFLVYREFRIPFTNYSLSFDSIWLIVLSVVFSWIGVKLVSLVTLGVVLFLGTVHIATLGVYMRFSVVYILTAYIGVLLYLSMEPKVIQAIPAIGNITRSAAFKVNRDLSESKSEIKSFFDKKHKE